MPGLSLGLRLSPFNGLSKGGGLTGIVFGANIIVSNGYVIIDSLSGNSVTITVVGGNHPGTYVVDLTALAEGPVQLVAISTSGTIGAGNVLTAVPGLWVGDATQGSITITNQWLLGASVIASNTLTYTQTGTESTTGLFVQETAYNAGGTTVGTKVTAIAQASYTAPRVQATGTAYLRGSPTLPTVTNSLMQFSFIYDGVAANQFFLCDSAQNLSYRVTSANVLTITQKFSTGSFNASTPALTAGDVVNVLFSANAAGTTRFMYQKNNGAWTLVNSQAFSVPSITVVDPITFLNNNTAGGQFTSKERGLRYWVNLASYPDVSTSLVQSYFYDASGNPQNPSIADAQYGTPLLEFFGNAAATTAGTNTGSGGNFTFGGTGSFADV